jgi:hypothetical protein
MKLKFTKVVESMQLSCAYSHRRSFAVNGLPDPALGWTGSATGGLATAGGTASAAGGFVIALGAAGVATSDVGLSTVCANPTMTCFVKVKGCQVSPQLALPTMVLPSPES